MAFILNSPVIKAAKNLKVKPLAKPPTLKTSYEIPQRYRDSFYLANAAFFDSVNWFLHKAFEVNFSNLKAQFKQIDALNLLNDDEVADKVEGIVSVLDQCNSVIDVRFPIKRDDGSWEVIRGFRAHHGLVTGYRACLGGIRIDENITRDHMKALSVLSTYRNACMGINMAGAHGGIKICPQKYSKAEVQQIVETYAWELIQKGYCGERDVFQPDINSSEREMSWISECYAKYTGQSLNVSSAGKPCECGELENYGATSSLGAFIALDFFLNNASLMEKIGLSTGLKGKTFIIQGLGKLGGPLAEMLVSNGAICVGVKDHDAYIYDSKGLDLQKLYEHKAKTGSIKNFGLCKPEVNDSMYLEQCDILIFAAYQKSLTCHIAKDVKAKMIVEAADGPITPIAHQILIGRSKLIVPDIYSCSGATVASYLEYLRNFQQIRGVDDEVLRYSSNVYENALNSMTRKEQKISVGGSSVQRVQPALVKNIISDTLECILADTGKHIIEIANLYQLGTDIRTAAYMVAINNVFKAIYHQKKFM